VTAPLLPAVRLRALLLVSLLLLPVCAFAAPSGKTSVGIFPVFQLGDSALGSAFAQHLTTMIYRQVLDSSLDPVLLNPGGLYGANADSETLDYARSANVSVVLITILASSKMPDKGDFIVHVDAKLVDANSGSELASWASTAPVSRHELMSQTANTYGRSTAGYIPGGSTAVAVADLAGSNSKPFDKTALGKTAHTIAEDIGTHLVQSAPAGSGGAPVAAGAQSCTVNFRVAYVTKHASSKSYDLVVNGKDESLDVKDGKVPLTLSSGPVLVQLSVHDAPYKMPRQDIYQANTRLACTPDQQTLVMELDSVGEGTLKWEQQ